MPRVDLIELPVNNVNAVMAGRFGRFTGTRSIACGRAIAKGFELVTNDRAMELLRTFPLD